VSHAPSMSGGASKILLVWHGHLSKVVPLHAAGADPLIRLLQLPMLNAECLLGNKQIACQGKRRKGRCLHALKKGRTTSTVEEASLTPACWCSSALLRIQARLLYWW
jgi:hypothetical protein